MLLILRVSSRYLLVPWAGAMVLEGGCGGPVGWAAMAGGVRSMALRPGWAGTGMGSGQRRIDGGYLVENAWMRSGQREMINGQWVLVNR